MLGSRQPFFSRSLWYSPSLCFSAQPFEKSCIVFLVLICISFPLVVFHCTSLSFRVKLESDKMMGRTLKCVFPVGRKKLIGGCGASTWMFLVNIFPHLVDEELTFMQQLWSECQTECTEISSSVTEAQRLHPIAPAHCRVTMGRECWMLCPVWCCREQKEREGSYWSWKQTRAPHAECSRRASGTWKNHNILSEIATLICTVHSLAIGSHCFSTSQEKMPPVELTWLRVHRGRLCYSSAPFLQLVQRQRFLPEEEKQTFTKANSSCSSGLVNHGFLPQNNKTASPFC